MLSAACKNDNSTCLNFLVIAPDTYFYFISDLYLSDHLKYFNGTM